MRRVKEFCEWKAWELAMGWKRVWEDRSGVGVVELILILVVLIGLVLIFKNQLTSLVNDIFDKITRQSNRV